MNEEANDNVHVHKVFALAYFIGDRLDNGEDQSEDEENRQKDLQQSVKVHRLLEGDLEFKVVHKVVPCGQAEIH